MCFAFFSNIPLIFSLEVLIFLAFAFIDCTAAFPSCFKRVWFFLAISIALAATSLPSSIAIFPIPATSTIYSVATGELRTSERLSTKARLVLLAKLPRAWRASVSRVMVTPSWAPFSRNSSQALKFMMPSASSSEKIWYLKKICA